MLVVSLGRRNGANGVMEDFQMQPLFEILRAPVVIGAFILAFLIVIGSYVGSRWYYGDVEPFEVLEVSAPTRNLPLNLASSEIDLSGLQGESEPMPTESKPTVLPAKGESVDDFLGELSEEEKALLTAEVVEALPPRESPNGLGPYPPIPPDYPRQNIWDQIDQAHNEGEDTINRELRQRVLIKLWEQGTKTDSALINNDTKMVYPLYKDTVFIEWKEVENEDGTIERYISHFRSHGSLGQYENDFRAGYGPSWIKVRSFDGAGIDPYSFLNLP